MTLETTLERVLEQGVGIDDLTAFRRALAEADSILFAGVPPTCSDLQTSSGEPANIQYPGPQTHIVLSTAQID